MLGQHPEVDYDAYWQTEDVCVSSHLTRIETLIAIRRAGTLLGREGKSWIQETITKIQPYLDAITCRYIDDSVEEIVRSNPGLSNCRTVDVIHLATALHFQSHSSQQLSLCSLDSRMREVAGRIGFTVLPR